MQWWMLYHYRNVAIRTFGSVELALKIVNIKVHSREPFVLFKTP